MDAQIDQLYQLPLEEFTAARNALAKSAGADGAAIKALEKPNTAAWAVNQLYWKQRHIFHALQAAATRRKAAHVKQLTGKRSDLDTADTAHRDAMKAATRAIRELLQSIGDPASPATMVGVTETLQALPSDAPFGRLSRPLKPMGFEALAGVVPVTRSGRGGPAPTSFAESLAAMAGGGGVSETPAARKQREKAAVGSWVKREGLERQLREARDAEVEAHTAVNGQQRALEEAERDRDEAADRLHAATEAVKRRREDLARAEHAAVDAAAERQRLEHEIGAL
jgi:hypothetical protein